jgi:hypothetical protein
MAAMKCAVCVAVQTATGRRDPRMDALAWMFTEVVLPESLHAPQELSDLVCDFDPDSQRILEAHYMEPPFPAYPANGLERREGPLVPWRRCAAAR